VTVEPGAPEVDDTAFCGQVATLLWPRRPTPADTTEFVVVPRAAQLRALLPRRPSRVAATAVAHRVAGQQGRARVRQQAIVLGARAGLIGVMGRERLRVGDTDSLRAYLSSLLGRPLAVAVHLGPPRANRKPVLQLLDPAGHTVAYAKVGINGLTDGLVSHEAAVLAQLADVALPGVRLPRLMHSGDWQGHALLVLSPLPVWEAGAAQPPQARVHAAGVLARVLGSHREPLATSACATRLRAVAEPGDAAFLAALDTTLGSEAVLEFGSWHGDFRAGNCALVDGALLVWDFERFGPDMPVGADLVHYAFSARISGGEAPGAAAAAVLADAPQLLRGVVGPEVARLVAEVTLLSLAQRYEQDRQAAYGTAGSWLLPALGGPR